MFQAGVKGMSERSHQKLRVSYIPHCRAKGDSMNIMAATSLISLIGVVCTHFPAISGSVIQSLNTCSCLGQIVSFECVVTGGTLTVWSGTAFACPSGEIALRHSNFVGSSGSCNNGAIIGRGMTSNGNQYTSRLDLILSDELVGRTVSCSVDDGNLNLIGAMTLAVNSTNTFLPPEEISVKSIGPEEIIFSWSVVPHDGCPSFRYNISSVNCGTCIPTLTTSNMSTCTNFHLESYPNTSNTCNICAKSIICENISGSFSSLIHVNLTVPGAPSVRSVPYYYNYKTSILEEIQTSFNTVGSIRISDSPMIRGDADNYTVTYADTTTGATCYSDTIIDVACEDGICKHLYYDSSPDSSCRQIANITVTVFATNVLGDGQMSTPINISGVNTFISVTFNGSTRMVLCNFSKTLPSDSNKLCIVTVTYGAECDQLLGTYTGTVTESRNLIASPPLELISGVSEYCLSINATSDNETVIVKDLIQPGTTCPSQNRFQFGYVLPLSVISVVLSLIIVALTVTIIIVLKQFVKTKNTLTQCQANMRVYEEIPFEERPVLLTTENIAYAHAGSN